MGLRMRFGANEARGGGGVGANEAHGGGGDWRANKAHGGGGLALTRRVVHIQVRAYTRRCTYKPVHTEGGAHTRRCTQKAVCSHRMSLVI